VRLPPAGGIRGLTAGAFRRHTAYYPDMAAESRPGDGAGSCAETGDERLVRPFGRADLRPTALMMARAFDDDPLMQWIFPDEGMRRQRLPAFFTASMRGTGLRHPGTELLVTGGEIAGCATWLPPGAWMPSTWQQLVALPGYIRTLGSRLGVASASYGALLRVHPQGPHWYLAGIGTDPPLQGTGIGSALMRSRLSRLDATQMPAYLESSKERNVPFYERHGFAVTRELTVPGGGPTLWLMWRTPRPPQEAP
jgi:ribosomal protein S18 acetylase RimI-like enzyme